jgi:hypothetical protein
MRCWGGGTPRSTSCCRFTVRCSTPARRLRSRVGCLRHSQGDLSAASDVTAYTDLTLRHLRAGTVRLILIGGPPAAGKTTLAGRVADRLGAVVLSSDHVRKELAGLDPVTSAAATYRQGIYAPTWTERTYAELTRRCDGQEIVE